MKQDVNPDDFIEDHRLEVQPILRTPQRPPGTVTSAIWFDDAAWEEAEIPQREWLARGYLLRRSVTKIDAPGAGSKSTYALSLAVHLALGLPLNKMKPAGEFKSLIFNAEDDADEQRRRLSGILRGIGKKPADVAGKIARVGPSEVGTLIHRDENGLQVDTAVFGEIKERIAKFRPDLLVLDPLAELHCFDESDNNSIRGVVAGFRSLAVAHNMAVLLLAHVRKGLTIPGDVDAGRGASSAANAARIVFTLTGMTAEDARGFGLPPEARKHYFRLDGSKSNYASLTDVEWFERAIHTLDNGDTVVAAAAWFPPVDVWTPETMAKIEAGIAKGSLHAPWSPQLGNNDRSVKHLLVDAGITTAAGQKEALATLRNAGFQEAHYKGKDRKFILGLRSPDGKPASFAWKNDAAK